MSEKEKLSLDDWSAEQRSLPPRLADEAYDDYFRRLAANWSIKAGEAERLHEKWKIRIEMAGDLRESDCMYRVHVVLKELMNSAFLKDDYIDTGMPQTDCEQALAELEEIGFGDLCQMEGAGWKFALLTRYFRKQAENRLMVDEKKAGFYIDEMREQITEDAAEAFFRFATFTQLAYREIYRIKREHRDNSLNDCIDSMKSDIEPLRDHVVSQYKEQYDDLLDDMLAVGDLLKKLTTVAPRNFQGGYNQKLACNLVGLLCSKQIYELTARQADQLIYIGATHYTYINNFADTEKTSVLTKEELKALKDVIKKYK